MIEPMEVRPANTAALRAAQYVRMSTEHQQYSTANQSATILQYAKAHGMEIVRSYIDAGKSGLTLTGRDALQNLIRTVEIGEANFDCILVYDVSRWGRFQDADESAYYEYICRRAGISVHYCAEEFQNDNSSISSLLKALKRTMAGEYSRELSKKVFTGQCRLAELGFRQGGPAGYGLRRQLIDINGKPKAILRHGERKSIQTDRVILVPGPAEEVAIVREIYDLFIDARNSEQDISDLLNARGILNSSGRRWISYTVREILTNPKYTGANVYNRHCCKLGKKQARNPSAMWLWQGLAFEPVVSLERFQCAQQIIEARMKRYTVEDMLALLRRLLGRKGFLSGSLIDQADDMPSSTSYRKHFGRLTCAYKLIGYSPPKAYSYAGAYRRMWEVYAREWAALADQLSKAGVSVQHDSSTNILTINGEYTASLILVRCRTERVRTFRWLVRLDAAVLPDIVIVGRMGAANRSVLDYYLLPCVDVLQSQILLAPDNAINLDVHRFEELAAFVNLGRRATLVEAP